MIAFEQSEEGYGMHDENKYKHARGSRNETRQHLNILEFTSGCDLRGREILLKLQRQKGNIPTSLHYVVCLNESSGI